MSALPKHRPNLLMIYRLRRGTRALVVAENPIVPIDFCPALPGTSPRIRITWSESRPYFPFAKTSI